MSTPRPVSRVLQAQTQQKGAASSSAGRSPRRRWSLVDPFLLLDEMGPVDYRAGRGGRRARPSAPRLRDGDLRARRRDASTRTRPATAAHRPRRRAVDDRRRGRGALRDALGAHSREGWAGARLPDLGEPAARGDKMMAPRYQEIPRARASRPHAAPTASRASVRVVAGEALGGTAVIETRTPICLQDWTLAPGGAGGGPASRRTSRSSLYVFGGAVRAGPERSRDPRRSGGAVRRREMRSGSAFPPTAQAPAAAPALWAASRSRSRWRATAHSS